MAERPMALSVPELERALVDLGRHLEYPPTPNFAARVRQQLAEQPARPGPWWESLAAGRVRSRWQSFLPVQRRLAFALVALIALVGAVLAISPEARTAVAERLGLRGVLIQEVPALPTALPTAAPAASPAAAPGTPGTSVGVFASPAIPTMTPSAGTRLALGQLLTLDQVRTRVAFQIPLPTALGPPDEVYLADTPPGGQVALLYYPRPDLPQAKTTSVGLLLTAFQGSVSNGALGKGLPPGTRLEEVRVNGGKGFWIEGDPHQFFYLDSRGQGRVETTRLAGNVLLWEQDKLTLRLESALAKDETLKIAATVH
jgi:hypothetical protein